MFGVSGVCATTRGLPPWAMNRLCCISDEIVGREHACAAETVRERDDVKGVATMTGGTSSSFVTAKRPAVVCGRYGFLDGFCRRSFACVSWLEGFGEHLVDVGVRMMVFKPGQDRGLCVFETGNSVPAGNTVSWECGAFHGHMLTVRAINDPQTPFVFGLDVLRRFELAVDYYHNTCWSYVLDCYVPTVVTHLGRLAIDLSEHPRSLKHCRHV